MRSSSFVPKLPASDAVARAEIDAALVALSAGGPWTFSLESSRTEELGPRVDRWTAREDAELNVDWVRDDSLHLRWISVLHPDAARRDELLHKLESVLPHHSIDELLADRRANLPRESRVVAAALALNTRFDVEVLAWIERALLDASEEMRANAAIAASLLLWPQLIPALEDAADREGDLGIEDMLRAALIAIRSANGFNR